MKFIALGLTAGLLLGISGCVSAPPAAHGDPRGTAITILHTNDHHGRFWRNADGEYGMAARKTVVDAIRAEVAAAGGYSLLLDGGDVNTGVPESDLQDAVPDFRGMNLLGYDAMAVSPHPYWPCSASWPYSPCSRPTSTGTGSVHSTPTRYSIWAAFVWQ